MYTLSLPDGFSLRDTLTCGQCFRWEETPDGFSGAVFRDGRDLSAVLRQQGGTLYVDSEADAAFWRGYLDLDEDYDRWKAAFSADPPLREAIAFCGGIRLLRQDPWEALISFILSANNNIPRIKGIIGRLCALFGSFPTPEQLSRCTPEDLSPIRAGFRTRYILDAARKVQDGSLDLSAVRLLPLPEAEAALRAINGVGPKVAQCVLLYGFHRLDAFPVDTWIKKALALYYPDGFPPFAEPKGVAQQYLFHYIRRQDAPTVKTR